MPNFLRILGRLGIDLFWYLGQLYSLSKKVISNFLRGEIRWRLACQQIVKIGFGSQLVVIITGAFTGAVFAAQTYYQFSRVGLETAVGAVVSVAMCRELGPVLAGLMVTGRVGAAMAAEIGTMKVTEQIDALRSMAVSPVGYLVTPRIVAIMISMPILVAEAIGIGIFAAQVMGDLLHVDRAWYAQHIQDYTEIDDVFIGLIKGLVFGILIVLISCQQGLKATNGAVGVGRGTTAAVVISSLAILISNFFLTIILNNVFPAGFVQQ